MKPSNLRLPIPRHINLGHLSAQLTELEAKLAALPAQRAGSDAQAEQQLQEQLQAVKPASTALPKAKQQPAAPHQDQSRPGKASRRMSAAAQPPGDLQLGQRALRRRPVPAEAQPLVAPSRRSRSCSEMSRAEELKTAAQRPAQMPCRSGSDGAAHEEPSASHVTQLGHAAEQQVPPEPLSHGARPSTAVEAASMAMECASAQKQPSAAEERSAAPSINAVGAAAKGQSGCRLRAPVRPPRGQLPPDMLSLVESASLLRAGRLLQHVRRAASTSGQESEHDSASASITAGAAQDGSTAAAAGAEHEAQQAGPPLLSQGTKRLAALRRQRRSQWLSDFSGGGPGRSSSQVGALRLHGMGTIRSRFNAESANHSCWLQDGEAPSSSASRALAPLAESRAWPGSAAEVASRPGSGGPAESTAGVPDSTHRQAATQAQTAPGRPRGMTQAQLRQQEAWGSLAGAERERGDV